MSLGHWRDLGDFILSLVLGSL